MRYLDCDKVKKVEWDLQTILIKVFFDNYTELFTELFILKKITFNAVLEWFVVTVSWSVMLECIESGTNPGIYLSHTCLQLSEATHDAVEYLGTLFTPACTRKSSTGDFGWNFQEKINEILLTFPNSQDAFS